LSSTVRDAIKNLRKALFTPVDVRGTVTDLYVRATRPKGQESGDFYSHLEERVTQTVPLNKLEKLYHLDFLTFRLVNDFIDSIAGPEFFLIGDDEICKLLMKWSVDVKLLPIIREIIRDCFLAGNAWVEIGYNKEGNDILMLRINNPKYMDYIRHTSSNYVELDDANIPIGYKKSMGSTFKDVLWKENSISVGGTVKQTFTGLQDGRDRISHFKLWSLGESYLGCTPLESCYRQAIVRLNISRNVGEGAYRSEGLIIIVGDEAIVPTNKQVDTVAEEFEDIETETIFAFKSIPKITVDRLPSPDIRDRERLLYYFADAFCTGMGKPVSMVMEPGSVTRATETEQKGMDYENRIRSLQTILAEQMKEKVFYKLMDARGISRDKLDKVVFKSNMPTIKLAKARRIATLTRYGLIKYDPKLEKWLRTLEDLPVDYLNEIIAKWEKEGIPETEKPKEAPEGLKGRISQLEDDIEELREIINENSEK